MMSPGKEQSANRGGSRAETCQFSLFGRWEEEEEPAGSGHASPRGSSQCVESTDSPEYVTSTEMKEVALEPKDRYHARGLLCQT